MSARVLDNALFLALFSALLISAIVYVYIASYDKRGEGGKRDRNVFCLKVFVLTFCIVYLFLFFFMDKGDNPLDHVYTNEPDF